MKTYTCYDGTGAAAALIGVGACIAAVVIAMGFSEAAAERERVRGDGYDAGYKDGWKVAARQLAAGKFLKSFKVYPGAKVSGCTFIIVATNDLVAGVINIGIDTSKDGSITDSTFDMSNLEILVPENYHEDTNQPKAEH